MKNKFYFAIVLLLLPLYSYSAAWTAPLPIKSLRIHPSYLAIYLENSIPAPDSNSAACAGSVIAINRNSVIHDSAYASLLAAVMTGKKVKFYVDGCNWNYMHTNVVWFNQD